MNRLALDTSTLRSSMAVERSDGAWFLAEGEPGRRHGRELVPMIRDLLNRAEIRARELDLIGVGVGPGSYTGLRVGVTAAKTLAYASGAALVGFDSLELFARAAPLDAKRIDVLSDAQRGDFHVGRFLRDDSGGLIRLEATAIHSPKELLASWTEPVAVVGPGMSRWEMPWPAGVTPTHDVEPDPMILLDLLDSAWAAGRRDDPWLLEPIYLRRSAAEDQWERRPK